MAIRIERALNEKFNVYVDNKLVATVWPFQLRIGKPDGKGGLCSDVLHHGAVKIAIETQPGVVVLREELGPPWEPPK